MSGASAATDRGDRRRAELAEGATSYALTQGLIGLSLRPLASALGTSDRMLLYHFGSKDDLVATVLQISNDRSVTEVRGLPPSTTVRDAVVQLWAACSSGPLEACQRLYVEAAALGLLGQEPYAGVLREANQRWLQALADHLSAAGCPPGHAPRAAYLLDATFMGLQLESTLVRETPEHGRAVDDLADTVVAIAEGARGGH